jgi:uncharacterized protein (TIGR02246 family)
MTIRRCVSLFAPLILLACVVLVPVSLGAQDKPDQLRTLSRDELDVVKVLTRQEHAWNEGNIEAFLGFYKDAPDTIFIGDHLSRGYESLVTDYKKNYPTRQAMGTLAFSDLEPRVLDERFAVLVGRYHLDRDKKSGGSADGMFSLVLEKTDKGWKIVVDHTS